MIIYPIDVTKLSKNGGSMNGNIEFTTDDIGVINIGKIILNDNMYGNTPPEQPVEGQLFFQIIE